MTKLGGGYLNPITFFNEKYKNGDFQDRGFWEQEQKTWGRIVHDFPHRSICKVIRDGNKIDLESNSKVYISIDGLIATELPDCAVTEEEALIILSSHLTTFLTTINLGGLYFSPISEKNIAHIELKDGAISQISGGGDSYSAISMERAFHRYVIPYHLGKPPLIEFNWVGMRIKNSGDVKACFELGKRISERLNFQYTEITLSLEAYKNYTVHKWNNTLLLGWAFLEILIDRIWKKFVLEEVKSTEKNRKTRLKDNRTYSAAVKTELLYANGIIILETYNNLNTLRQIRNSLIHSGHAVIETEVNVIFELIKTLINIITDIEPNFHSPGWARSGGWIQK